MNTRTKLLLSSLCALLLLSQACVKKTGTADINLGKDYFPTKTGSSITYLYDSTIYDDFFGVVFTNQYKLKDIVDSSFLDQQGDSSFVITRYISPDSVDNFVPFHVFYVTKVDNQIQVVEQNQRMIKLVFPVSYTGVWNGNSYIATSSSDFSWLSDWRYKYSSIGAPFQVNDTTSYASTITVDQRNNAEGDTAITNTNFGAYTFAKEVYAQNVGLVYRKLVRWKKDPAIGGGKRRGYAIELKAIDHQ